MSTEARIAAVVEAALAIPIEDVRAVVARARQVAHFTPLFDPSGYVRQGRAVAAALSAADAFLEFRVALEKARAPGGDLE